MTRWLWFLPCLLCAFSVARADEQMRRVEEELRKRKLYFGNIDGERNPEIAEAIRRFQERKGLDPTGEVDEGTLRALRLLPPATLRSRGSTRLQQSRDFIEAYLRATEKNDESASLFYADWVDYFDDGQTARSTVIRREREKAGRWPERRFTVMRFVTSPHGSDPDAMIVTFRYRFLVRSPEREMTGVEDNTFVVKAAGPVLRIVAMKSVR